MTYIPATLQLMNETITTAQTAATKVVVSGLARAATLNVQCIFTYGGGGTSAKVWVQTSFDGGVTWMDIANFAHTTASLNRAAVFSILGSSAIATVTDGTLADNTLSDGFLGDQLRVKFTSTGTYNTNTTCKVYAVVKNSA